MNAASDLAALGIVAVVDDSSQRLGPVLREVEHPCLIYLDAPGGAVNGSDTNPLLKELAAISGEAQCRDRCVIFIHDCLVPGQQWAHNWGDWGRGVQPLSYQVVQPLLPSIYPAGWGHHFNDQAEGACRGIVYIYPAR